MRCSRAVLRDDLLWPEHARLQVTDPQEPTNSASPRPEEPAPPASEALPNPVPTEQSEQSEQPYAQVPPPPPVEEPGNAQPGYTDPAYGSYATAAYPGYSYYSQGYGQGYGQGYPPSYGAAYGQGYPQSSPSKRPAPPGWVWVVVVAVSLVVGFLGSVLGTALVLAGNDASTPVATGTLATQSPLPAGNNDIAQVAAKLLPSTVQIIADIPGPGADTGSGFVFDHRGHVITNNHVVAAAADGGKITVVDYQGKVHKATIVGRSQVYDVAVLQVKGIASLPPAALGSTTSLRVGDPVVAIGSPLGLSSTVTSGIVSALDRPVTAGSQKTASFFSAVQTDAAINPGNSGGPLVNMQGEVIGVNSAIATVSRTATEAGNIGVGFAIPVEQVKRTAQQILSSGQAEYPVIGASIDVGSRGNGAYVEEVPAGTPAAKAGIEKGDVIVAIDGTPVRDGVTLIVLIRKHLPGDTVTLSVRRDGTVRKYQLVLDGKTG